MVIHKFSDTERDTAYSSILFQKDYIKLEDLNEIADEMLQPFSDIDNDDFLPREFLLHKEIISELNDRIESISKIANILYNRHLLDSEEIIIVDYGCGQGFASLAFLNFFYEKKEIFDTIKQVILVDKDKDALKRALLHYSVLFPTIDVIAYNQDILDKNFYVECNSVLTINLFSHILECDFNLLDHIKHLVLKGHNILMHNILLDRVRSYGHFKSLKSHYFNYAVNSIKDYTGCKIINKDFYHIKPQETICSESNYYEYAILSRTEIEKLSIPLIQNHFNLLCSGNPSKKFENVPIKLYFFNSPLEDDSVFCEELDDNEKILGDSIKYCAKHFEAYDILYALNNGLPVVEKILSVYEKAANNGITEAYNNLGVLFDLREDKGKDNNIKRSIEFYKLAAKGGSSSAMINLASYYMEIGNIDEAIDLYKSAAQDEHFIAYYNLAIINHFGLYGHDVDLLQAEELYRKCLKKMKPGIFQKNELKEAMGDEYDIMHNQCLLNLMLLLEEKGEHFLKIYDFYINIRKPSEEMTYCFNILQIKHALTIDRMFLNKYIRKEGYYSDRKYNIEKEPFVLYNNAIFNYYGIYLSDYDKKGSDKKKAFDIIKSLADDNKDWHEKDRYIYECLKSWTFDNNETKKVARTDSLDKDIEYLPIHKSYNFYDPQNRSELIFTILSKDNYFNIFRDSSDLCDSQSMSLMPFVSKMRENEYEYIYWAYLYGKDKNDINLKLDIYRFFKSKCNKSLDNFFYPATFCEKIMLYLAKDIANNTEDIDFICKLGDFYLNGNNSYWAVKFYNIAKNKGCESKNAIIEELNSRIEEEERKMKLNRQLFNDRLEDYYDAEDRWYAMTDGQYGDYPGGDIDYDIFGF